MAAIALDHVDKVYPNGFAAARDLSLEVHDGELLVLVGPSGSGKSTVLRMIAGLEQVSSGRIMVGERDVTDLPPQERDLAMVFQSYALYPHMTVRENMAFGLRIRHLPARETEERVRRVAASLQLDAMLDRKPAQLSGGQRQRVALARAIVREPVAFLFDEPLSNLDARLRLETRTELARLHRQLGTTMVYVTHDQVEAMTLGQRVAVLREGVLQQLGPPLELYNDPANRFVAGFIGSPPMEFIDGRLERVGNGVVLHAGARAIPVPTPSSAAALPSNASVGIRPATVELTARDAGGASDASVLPGVVSVVEQLGREQVVHIDLELGGTTPAQRITSIVPSGTDVHVDATVGVRLPRAAMLLFGEDGARVRTEP